MAACGSANKNADVQIPVADSIPDVTRLQPYEAGEDIQLNNVTYAYHISRCATDSLPHVKSEQGTVYADNTITLTIENKKSGATILTKTYTKNSFASIISDASFLKGTLLLGIAYDGIDKGRMHFVASVGDPELDDLYFPLDIFVSTDGSVSVQKSVEMDGGVPNDSLSDSQD